MPNMIDSVVNWNLELGNHPDLKILMDQTPVFDCYSELKIGTETLYYCNKDGVFNYYLESPSNPHGFGGSTFSLRMKDGTTRNIKGPWSTRAGVLNRFGIGPIVDCYLQYPTSKLPRIIYNGAVSLELALAAVRKAGAFLVCCFGYREAESCPWYGYEDFKGREFWFCASRKKNVLAKVA